MPNRKTHVTVGAIAGAATAFFQARNQPLYPMLCETAGGAIAGFVGGQIADRIDSPTSPRHRSIAHSILLNGAIGTWYVSQLSSWQNHLRSQATGFVAKKQQSNSLLEQLWYGLLEALCRVGAGVLSGLGAGHASHLALDAITPAGLPWIA